MSLLTDTDVARILCKDRDWQDKEKKLHIYPFAEDSLTPVGYDLRVGTRYVFAVDATRGELAPNQKIHIRPRDTVLITTLEEVGMPENRTVSAFITSKVTQVSQGLSHISTNIDADWNGPLLIAMHNPSTNTVTLTYGEAFCTINFIENKSPSTKACGKPPGRSDVLLDKFFEKSKEQEQRRRLYAFLTYVTKIVVISITAVVCSRFFPSKSEGFIAGVAIGTALVEIFSSGRR